MLHQICIAQILSWFSDYSWFSSWNNLVSLGKLVKFNGTTAKYSTYNWQLTYKEASPTMSIACHYRNCTFSPGTCEASRGASKSAFSRHMVWLSQWKFPVKSRWSGAGYLLHITTTAVQHNRDDMSVLCLINNGHDIHLYPYHSTFCRRTISPMSWSSAMLPWSASPSSVPVFFFVMGSNM